MRNAIQSTRKLVGRITDAPYALAAAVVTAGMSRNADASGNGIKGLSGNLTNQLGAVGQLIIAGSFVAGIILVAAGLMKLKQAADTGGQQVKYGEGLWRLGIGAALVGLTAVVGIGTETIFGNDKTSSNPAGVSGFGGS